ncbi:N-acetylmuramoyl-L-alanine amidase [Neobacillus sp. LXY-1]|uniref:N-acetylmuramoyl-L-alanine amidase n=1 Tax=Neobacillus sp. LXY-1 TaxID=3379133 RepID=UPI003EE17BD4
MKLYLDPGHGGADPGAQGNGINEKDVTLEIALRIRAILQDHYENVEVRMSRSDDSTKSLGQRTGEANTWGADYYLSIHANAADSSASGYEDYIYNGLSDSSTTAHYRDIIHAEVMRENELTDRGKKKANYHVLRESNMPATLSENGFISNAHDASLMKSGTWQQQVAQGHVNGLAKAFNLKRKPTPAPTPNPSPSSAPEPTPGTLNKVYAGSFKERKHTDERVAALKNKGIDAFIHTTPINGETWYRVQVGAFANRKNADQRLAEIKQAGFSDAFVIIENRGAVTANDPTPVNEERNEDSGAVPNPASFTIFGPTFLSPEKMNRFVKSVNPDSPDLGNYYYTIGEYYGIRGDVAFAQALHETNFFRFTGVVKPGQDNYAGIGATGGDNPGASFQTPEEGVIAHFQHLFAYATTRPLPSKYPLVDPRFHLVHRGSAATWISLNGKWAVPGATYGQSVLSLYNRMLQFSIQHLSTIQNEISS